MIRIGMALIAVGTLVGMIDGGAPVWAYPIILGLYGITYGVGVFMASEL
jgi:hypothetical protein